MHERRGCSCKYRGLLAHAPIEMAEDGGLKTRTSVEDACASTEDCLHTRGRRSEDMHERRGRLCEYGGLLAHAPIENAGDGKLKTYTSVEDACAYQKLLARSTD